MTDAEILEMGFMLEEKGLSHSQIDDILEHAGVKGMRWGVRRRARIDRTSNVGRGKGSLLDKARVHGMANPIDLLKTGSFKKSAARKGARFERRNEAMAKGEAKFFKDLIPTYGATRLTDLIPSTRKKKLTADNKSTLRKMSSGEEAALAVISTTAGLAVGALISSRR